MKTFPLFSDEIRRQFENASVKMIITVPILLEVATTIAPTLPGYRSTICIGGEDDVSKNVHGLQSLLTGNFMEYMSISISQICFQC